MSIVRIAKVLRITTTKGAGTAEDPVRYIETYVDPEDYTILDVIDPYLNQEPDIHGSCGA